MAETNLIYLDHAASTAVHPTVAAAMAKYWSQQWGNPNSLHRQGRSARSAVEKARRQVADLVQVADPAAIVFTGGGTEANNLAVLGVVQARLQEANPEDLHVVTTAVEHSSVLEPCRALARLGVEVTYVPVDRYGRVDPAAIWASLRPNTLLVSVMLANNEVGTLQPVDQIGQLLQQLPAGKRPLFHTDAVQAAGQIHLAVDPLGVDLLTLSGHKIYGPKGVGALYVSPYARQGLSPLLYGGGQEGRLRPGTENVPGIVGLGAAAVLARKAVTEDARQLQQWRDELIAAVQHNVPGAKLNGHPRSRLPNNVHFTIPGVASDTLLIQLDLAGVAASSGSACAVGAVEPSHVLQAMGRSREEAQWSLRLTLGRANSRQQITRAAVAIGQAVDRIRSAQKVTTKN